MALDLDTATKLALAQHWAGRRKEANARGWCRMLVEFMPAGVTLDQLTTADIQRYVDAMREAGLEPATVHARVCVISTVYEVAKYNGYTGPVPPIPYPNVPRKLKWWLTPDMQQELIPWLTTRNKHQVADFILWTIATGLRVEETLRVTRGHLSLNGTPSLLVPGTKTGSSQVTLALSTNAVAIACTRFTGTSNHKAISSVPPTKKLFSMSYDSLQYEWSVIKDMFGWTESTATLKALRRSFARVSTVNGMPLPVLQQMLRHRSIHTTMGYLQLVGEGFTIEEQRQWLK